MPFLRRALAAAALLTALVLPTVGSASPAMAYPDSDGQPCRGWSAGDYHYLHCTYADGSHRLFVSGNGSSRYYTWYE